VILIKELNAKFVEENRFRFFKRHLMFFEICSGLRLIPFELNHTYIVFTDCNESNQLSLVYANRRNLSTRVRVVMDWLAGTLQAYAQEKLGAAVL
jgi:hypothetical protein